MVRYKYSYCTSVTIYFDNEFKVEMYDNLDNIKSKIEWAFGEYGFESADVVSNETGEILLEAIWE